MQSKTTSCQTTRKESQRRRDEEEEHVTVNTHAPLQPHSFSSNSIPSHCPHNIVSPRTQTCVTIPVSGNNLRGRRPVVPINRGKRGWLELSRVWLVGFHCTRPNIHTLTDKTTYTRLEHHTNKELK